jgi:ParB family chromosome partitioning protein
MQRHGLGRGLSSLLQNTNNAQSSIHIIDINCFDITPNPNQPRKYFAEGSLNEMAESIKIHGVLLPIIVKKHTHSSESYELIAGERRWRACQIACITKIPCRVITASDQEACEISILENIQRENLSIIEEADFYKRLVNLMGYTHEKIAQAIGKSRSHVSNIIRTLDLPDIIQTLISEQKISHGHAKLLISTDDPLKLAEEIIHQKLSVHDLARILQKRKSIEENIAKKNQKTINRPTNIDKKSDQKHYSEYDEEIERAREFIEHTLNVKAELFMQNDITTIKITCDTNGMDRLISAIANYKSNNS